MNKIMFALAVTGGVFLPSVHAGTWTLTSDHPADGAIWSSMAYWTADGQPGETTSSLLRDADYEVLAGVARFGAQDVDFPGNRLTLSGGTFLHNGPARFTCADLVWEGGYLQEAEAIDSGSMNEGRCYTAKALAGKLTIPAGRTVTAWSSASGRGMEILSAVHGKADSVLAIGSMEEDRQNTKWVFHDLANFRGEIRVMSSAKDRGYGTVRLYGKNVGYAVQLQATSMPGTLHVCGTNSTLFLPDIGTTAAVGALNLEAGSVLSFAFDPTAPETAKARSGFLSVDRALTLGGKVAVRAVYEPIASVTGEALRTALLKAPPNVRLDVDQFVFEPNAWYEGMDGYTVYPQRLHLEVEAADGDGRETLVAVVEPIVVQRPDHAVTGTPVQEEVVQPTIFERADPWSDGRVPHAGAHYVRYYSGDTPIGEWDFPGQSITFGGPDCFFHTQDKIVRIPKIRVADFAFYTDDGSDIRLVGETVEVLQQLRLVTWHGATAVIDAEIVGAGDIVLVTASHGTGVHDGSYELLGLNTNFSGKVTATMKGCKPDYSPSLFGSRHKSLLIRDGRSLGGPRAEFAHDALSLGSFSELRVTNDVCLASGLNRGLLVERGDGAAWQAIAGGGRITVADGAVCTLNWPVTLSVADADFPVTLWKDGSGTLALGGNVKFLTAAGLSDELPANVPLPVLGVTNGVLKALSPDCVDGLTVALAPGTEIALDLSAMDSAFRRSGIRNVKTGVPFGAGRIRIVAQNLPDLPKDGETFGLLTVKTAVAGDIAARLSVIRPRVADMACRLVRTDDADARTTTFAVDYRPSGLLLFYR